MPAKSAKTKFDVYQAVTDAITAKLQQGVIPWRKPWNSADGNAPRNFISKRTYRGINVFLLGMQGYGNPNWMTFKQASELGYRQWLKATEQKDSQDAAKAYQKLAICEPGESFDPLKHKAGVRKGEKSTLITFWKLIVGKDPKTGEKTGFPMLRHFNVFNFEQTQGLDALMPKVEEMEDETTIDPIEACEQIVANMPEEMPRPSFGGGRAFYNPETDSVRIPEMKDFTSSTGFYSVTFHELVHATGHKSRLNRPELAKAVSFGDEEYSKEELTAEMGAAMLCATAGIEPDYDNSAAYIKGWLKALNNDPKMIVGAAGKAQKAADYILGVTPEPIKDSE